MAITLITGPANAGKAQLVMDGVRRHLAHGEEPLLVVPTHADAEHYRRELAAGGVVLGARVERFDGLIDEVVRRTRSPGEPLDGLARERLIGAIATRERGSPASAGIVRALSELFAELGARRVSPARFQRALAQWATLAEHASAKAWLGRLFARYADALAQMGRQDREQMAIAALDELRRAPRLWGRSPVLFYGFDDLTPLQLDTIETLGRVVDAEVTVSLTFERGRVAFAGRAGTFAALAPLVDPQRRRELEPRSDYYAPESRALLSHLERSLFEADAQRAAPSDAVRLLEGGGERAELELVAREVRLLLDAGTAPEAVAVVLRRPAAVADLLEEVFAAAGVPLALERRRRFADTSFGGALVGLLRCVGDGASDGVPGELADLLAWLRAPGLLDRPELADRLEREARRLGFTTAEQARGLWQQRHWHLDTIEHLEQASRRGPVALIDRAARELEWLFEAPRRHTGSVLDGEEGQEAEALSAGRRALAELRELARAAPSLAPAAAVDLAGELERVEFFSGGRAAAGAVAVLDPLGLRARRVRALLLCGLQEGAFPARARPQALLSQDERAALAQASGLLLGEPDDQLAAERYLLYAALSRPEQLLCLSWHVADDDGEPAARSLFVDDVLDLLDASAAELPSSARRPLGAIGWGGVAEAAVLRDERTGAEPLRDPRVLSQLAGHLWSASSFETWIGCPVRWFVERLLRADTLDPQAEPLARGALAHAALKDTLEALRARTGSARLTPASLGLARELLDEAIERNAPEFSLSPAPERRPGAMRRLRADLERYLEHAAAEASPLEPSALELGFGFDVAEEGSSGLAVLELGDGVRMRGRIDRVDVAEDGQAVVYDYKARSAPPAARWSGDGKLQVALYMRAVEQLLGVPAAGGFYQPLSGPDLRARGLLDADSGIELDSVSGDVREHAEVRELLDEALAAAREAAAQAARGELEPRPGTCAYGGGCSYPSICRCGR